MRFFTGPRGRICLPCQKKARSQSAHAARVQSTYGLGPGEYERLLSAQGGVCAVCRQSRARRLDVDHCHRTGIVRGLCCARCNRQLLARGLRDDPVIARAAAAYLENPPAVQILGKRFYNKST
ncbi:endonuclease VII domain-containing protein [Streptomyces sp. NPDC006798]|uniref:endonuclease VII domain-containing protein n=1 Tax=Streptomyces sp. NPDC006798 TaxID=3155462 RepID=UPI0033C10954